MNNESGRKKLLLIGWDAADWKIMNPLIDAGKMPALESMISQGVMGNLSTIRPILSPMLWTSIATGKRAYKHGIHGFTEPTPDGGGIRPITNLSRKAKAFWNIFNQNGMRGNVVGWWPSNPAEPINGVMVSDHFQKAKSIDPTAAWPMAPGTVHPSELADELSEFRFHPGELVDAQVRPFVPHAHEVDQDKDRRMAGCMTILSECTSLHAATTHLLETRPWDYTAVYMDAIDHFCHGFMKYHPPRQEFVSEQDFRLYSNVVEAGYRYHDMMLATLLAMAGDDTTVILLSDHGFHPDHLRLRNLPNEPAAPASEHRDLGVVVMKGPGIRKDERIYGASVLDICPTLLVAAGLPVGEDMDGKPLLQAWEEPPEVGTIPTWEEIPGETGQHPPETTLDPVESQQAIKQLVELGYIDEPAEDEQTAIANTLRDQRFNLAQAYMDADRHAEAAEILKELFEESGEEPRFGMRLLFCHRALNQIDEMKPLLDRLRFAQRERSTSAAQRLAERVEEFSQRPASSGDPEDEDALSAEAAVARFNELQSGGNASEDELRQAFEAVTKARTARFNRAMSLATQREQKQLMQLVRDSQTQTYSFGYLDGYVLMAEGKVEEAISSFQKAEEDEPNRPWLPIQIGEAYKQLKRWDDAERNFLRAIEIDPENAQAYSGLASCYLGLQHNLKAADTALTAVGLQFYFPYAHYVLGCALHRLGRTERAVEALETAVSINPNFAEAHGRLAAIYGRKLSDPDKAALHERLARKAAHNDPLGATTTLKDSVVGIAASDEVRRQEHEGVADFVPSRPDLKPRIDRTSLITIVTGLPRSGTSMLMQMLEAGGIGLLADGVREADESNPRGYCEHERVKKARTDVSWLPEARGKAVKIVPQLLPTLPRDDYRIIFIDRSLDEVVASQRSMLDRAGRRGGALSEGQLKDTFVKQIRVVGGMLSASSIPVLKVRHRDCIENPTGVASEINRFLGGGLDEEAMKAAVDPRLYRERTDVPVESAGSIA